MGGRQRSQLVEPIAAQIAFGRTRRAAKDLAVESRQRAPVARGQVGVNVFGGDGHIVIDGLPEVALGWDSKAQVEGAWGLAVQGLGVLAFPNAHKCEAVRT